MSLRALLTTLPARVVVLDLAEAAPYTRIVAQVDDPDQTVAALRSALSAS